MKTICQSFANILFWPVASQPGLRESQRVCRALQVAGLRLCLQRPWEPTAKGLWSHIALQYIFYIIYWIAKMIYMKKTTLWNRAKDVNVPYPVVRRHVLDVNGAGSNPRIPILCTIVKNLQFIKNKRIIEVYDDIVYLAWALLKQSCIQQARFSLIFSLEDF